MPLYGLFRLKFRSDANVPYSDILSLTREYINANPNVAANWSTIGKVIGGVKANATMRWADPMDIKQAAEQAFTDKFGSKEEAQAKAKAQAKVN